MKSFILDEDGRSLFQSSGWMSWMICQEKKKNGKTEKQPVMMVLSLIFVDVVTSPHFCCREGNHFFVGSMCFCPSEVLFLLQTQPLFAETAVFKSEGGHLEGQEDTHIWFQVYSFPWANMTVCIDLMCHRSFQLAELANTANHVQVHSNCYSPTSMIINEFCSLPELTDMISTVRSTQRMCSFDRAHRCAEGIGQNHLQLIASAE